MTSKISKWQSWKKSLNVELYNSLGNRVPAIQKHLVLDAALKFEKEIVNIKEQKIAWNNNTVLAN